MKNIFALDSNNNPTILQNSQHHNCKFARSYKYEKEANTRVENFLFFYYASINKKKKKVFLANVAREASRYLSSFFSPLASTHGYAGAGVKDCRYLPLP